MARFAYGNVLNSALRLPRSNGFSPSALFAASEPGAWYDPSDLSTMFQDSAGTTPVTATGQTVGLVLDKSKGLVLGPEQLSVGFAITQAGAPAAAYNTVTGQCSVSRVSSSVRSYVRFNLTSTSFYRLTIQNTGGGSLEVSALVGGGLVASGQTVTLFTSGASSPTIFANTDGTTVTFTVVSIKELPGNHATQTTAASRPIYGIEPFGGRRNLATFTEDFSNGAWSKSAATVSTNVAIAPGGTTTADRIVEDSTNAPHGFQNLGIYSGVATGTNTCNSIYCKADTRSRVAVGYTASGGVVSLNYIAVDLTNGTVLSTSGVGGTTESVGDGWYRIKLNTVPMGATTGRLALNVLRDTDTVPTAYLGDGASGVLVWGAQGEVSNAVTAYQRVTDQWNVTEAGKASVSYLQYDGTDDFLVTGTITPGIDKAQVFAGVRKLSDAASGMVAELSTSWASNAGTLFLHAPESNGTGAYSGGSRGAAGLQLTQRVVFNSTAPDTRVVTFTHDISGDLTVGRMDGVQQGTATGDKGTGNFLAYPLYIGRRAGTTLPFNGRIYQMLVRFGANLSAATITQTETWMNSKTGAYLPPDPSKFTVLGTSGSFATPTASLSADGTSYATPKTVLAANGTSYTPL